MSSCSSTIVSVKPCYHVLKIDGYSRIMDTKDDMLQIVSCPFLAGGHTWQLFCYPMKMDFIAVYLVLCGTVVVDEGAVIVQATFSLLDQDGGKPVPSYSRTTTKYDFSRRKGVGFYRFVKRNDLEQSSELLKDDCFAVRVDLHLINVKEAEAPQSSSSTTMASDLHQQLGDLLSKSKAGTDVEFRVGGETFPAHRLVLKARSPVFKAELQLLISARKEAGATDANVVLQIILDDIEPQVFKALLTFIYTDAIPAEMDDFVMAQSLLLAADKYGIHRLKLVCEDRLCGYINTRSVSTLLALAEEHKCPGLKEACFDFLGSKEVLSERSGATTVVKVRCYHVIKIDGYSRTLNSHGARPTFNLRPFRAGGHTWHVRYRPMGSPHHPENTEFVSFYLVLDDIVDDAVTAEVTFSLLKQDGTPAKTQNTTVHNFSLHRSGGCESFIKREELERSEFLKDDCFSIRVHVHIVKQKQATPYVTVPPSDLHRHLGDLLSSKEDADIEFKVGGETFAAHRVVLAARSPVFMAELFGPMKMATNLIQVHDIEPRVFDTLLTFIYTDAWPELEKEDESAMTQHMLVAADRHGLQRLKLMCEDRLCSHINSKDSAATILALAELHCCPRLKDACFEFLTYSGPVIEKGSQQFKFLAQSCPTLVEELAQISEKIYIN